ncbi:MAG: hypothetical protein UY98_C0013G0015, partial [Candidatus Kaiserbacteria bacterium GW2011_GWA2_58_9]
GSNVVSIARRTLGQDFFERRPQAVARELLGAYLVRRADERLTKSFMITETEAYDGPDDLACHASRGRTKRTEVMFGPPGHWYVYFVYGMHEMLNIVTGPEGYPSAVLIRGVQYQGDASLLNGPGKLTRELDITRELNGKPAISASGLWIEERDEVRPHRILQTPRVGVAYAGEWAKKPWRYVLSGHVPVSR